MLELRQLKSSSPLLASQLQSPLTPLLLLLLWLPQIFGSCVAYFGGVCIKQTRGLQTMTNMQIYVAADWHAKWTKPTNYVGIYLYAKVLGGAFWGISCSATVGNFNCIRRRMHQVKVKNFCRATRKSVLKSIKEFSVCIFPNDLWAFPSTHTDCGNSANSLDTPFYLSCVSATRWPSESFVLMPVTHIEGCKVNHSIGDQRGAL